MIIMIKIKDKLNLKILENILINLIKLIIPGKNIDK
jgi:hypothetical protein